MAAQADGDLGVPATTSLDNAPLAHTTPTLASEEKKPVYNGWLTTAKQTAKQTANLEEEFDVSSSDEEAEAEILPTSQAPTNLGHDAITNGGTKEAAGPGGTATATTAEASGTIRTGKRKATTSGGGGGGGGGGKVLLPPAPTTFQEGGALKKSKGTIDFEGLVKKAEVGNGVDEGDAGGGMEEEETTTVIIEFPGDYRQELQENERLLNSCDSIQLLVSTLCFRSAPLPPVHPSVLPSLPSLVPPPPPDDEKHVEGC